MTILYEKNTVLTGKKRGTETFEDEVCNNCQRNNSTGCTGKADCIQAEQYFELKRIADALTNIEVVLTAAKIMEE